jgi:hypothetical protein
LAGMDETQQVNKGPIPCNLLIHLLICNAEMICEPMITEGNKRKRQSQMTLPFSLVIFCADLLL